jgi:hypothetical protein
MRARGFSEENAVKRKIISSFEPAVRNEAVERGIRLEILNIREFRSYLEIRSREERLDSGTLPGKAISLVSPFLLGSISFLIDDINLTASASATGFSSLSSFIFQCL